SAEYFKEIFAGPDDAVFLDVLVFILLSHQIRPAGPEVHSCFHFGKILWQHLSHWCRRQHHIPVITTEDDIAMDSIDPLRISEMPVIGYLIYHKKRDDHTNRHSN